ncbi:MAG: outer membrane beta-barrel domain-containing protein [Sutterellaceae bacterium]|nr:outer membrane beta-barrel domain-containing protein [Burkholderiaceae bacterium]MDW8428961.1 outer membrane beta-barrel domain-containing protein [Sutterellaceae bacterium]
MHLLAAFFASVIALPLVVSAQTPQPASEQVIQPQVQRREVRLPRFPSRDFELGLFAGTIATDNFGASTVYGARFGYHITEDIFVQAAYGRTEVSDENFRQILPGGLFARSRETLTYYNLSAGFNILPGEVFIGRNLAKASALYVIGGIGSTSFLAQRKQTLNVGLGLRVFLRDWAALQVDFRDHVFALDLLGKRRNTQNLELSAGLTFFF